MSTETIAAVYDTSAHAHEAVAALHSAGVPADSITVHARDEAVSGSTSTGTAAREPGFWSSLFGGDSGSDDAVYSRSLDEGATVVTVRTPEEHITRVTEILEQHGPVDMDDRAAQYGISHADTGAATPMMARDAMADTTGTAARSVPATASETMASARPATGEGMMQLSEEALSVGKRVVNRGGTRIRRYVVETPVQEDVTLHSEKVVLDRHPVTETRTGTADFSEKTIEMTETVEEAVVSKTAHVYEEVGLRKEVSDRVETIKDTVRKEEVEVEQIPATPNLTTTTETNTTRSPKV